MSCESPSADLQEDQATANGSGPGAWAASPGPGSQGHPVPSAHAREVVAGAYDLHVHVAPDIIERRISDLELAARFCQHSLSGFVLKSHYTMTAERAAVVRSTTSCEVHGAITLNWSVGGINPLAVEVCARAGGRVVWMPTIDAPVRSTEACCGPPPGRPPAWQGYSQLLSERGVTNPPIHVVGEDGRLTAGVRLVLDVVAQHRMVLCTGHLDRDDVLTLVRGAKEQGVEAIVVTHPDTPAQRLTGDVQRHLAQQGCLLERCFGTPYSGRIGWDELMANIRAAGVASSLISSDLGQVQNPPVEDGLALMADRLLAGGFSEQEARRMCVTNTRQILGAAT
ncbi:MAG TPA: DUF6282 family protein [Streptosporangiaceae bacterium]|nr:DUF6282 family protein [Streptosporangiaceae bacterium]